MHCSFLTFHSLYQAIIAHGPTPYLITRRWVYEVAQRYGTHSAYWQARVRGEFPEQGEDALISLKWLEASAKQSTRMNTGTAKISGAHGPAASRRNFRRKSG